MARAHGVYRRLHCHSCDREWGATIWSYSEDWSKPKKRPTCICPHPHVEILPSLSDLLNSHTVQVRASQRAVVYQMPDGTYENPMTNSYEDTGAVDCVARGGVRMDFPHLRDLEQFNRLHSSKTGNEHSMRAHIIDYDHASIASGSAMHPARVRTQEQMKPEKRSKGVYFGSQLYDEAKKASGR